MRRALPVLAAGLFAAGCGYVGDPRPPLANIPAGVTDLAAVQRDARIVVQFSLPRTTTESMRLRTPLTLDLRVGAQTGMFNKESWAAEAARIPEGHVENGLARYEIPSGVWAGKDISIAVRTTGRNGKPSDWSNFANLHVVPPPVMPAAVRAEPVPTGVKLTWTAAGSRFRILRRSPGSEAFTPAATVQANDWTDTSTEYGKQYSYIVQTVVEAGGGQEAESEPSAPVSITPEDIFPPATPTGLRIATAPNSLELAWDRDSEADLAGYRVYRAAPGGELQKIADVGAIPAYSDHAIEHGKIYRYAVSAVDNAGNESPRSVAVEAVDGGDISRQCMQYLGILGPENREETGWKPSPINGLLHQAQQSRCR